MRLIVMVALVALEGGRLAPGATNATGQDARSVRAGRPPSTCGLGGEYERALCSYQKRQFAEAEAGFRAIVERGEANPQTIRSMYFLARTLMKTGRFDEAGTLLIRIYSLDKPFYDAWSCDYLLGECRKAAGKG